MHYLRRCSINLKTKNYVSKCSALSAQKTHWRCQLAKHLCVETKARHIQGSHHRDDCQRHRNHRFALAGRRNPRDEGLCATHEEGARGGQPREGGRTGHVLHHPEMSRGGDGERLRGEEHRQGEPSLHGRQRFAVGQQLYRYHPKR